MFTAKLPSSRWPRALVGGLATAIVLGLSLASTPAQADDPILENPKLEAQADDTRSVGRCQWGVESVDTSNGTVTGMLSASAQPKSLLLSFGNKFVVVQCDLFSPTGAHLATLRVEENGNRIQWHGERRTVALHNGYQLCAFVATVMTNGQIHNAGQCEASF